MFGSTILDVAIGLIFSFLAISLFTSATVEAINSLLQLRAVNLKSGIMALVNDPGFAGLAKGLYEHPLVSPLGPGVQQAPAAGAAAQAPIPARPATDNSTYVSRVKDVAMFWRPAGPPYVDIRTLPAYIDPSQFARALLDVTRLSAAWAADAAAAPPGAPPGRASLDAAIAAIANPQIRDFIKGVSDRTQGDINAIESEVAAWFDGAMDRVSGEFKRWTQAATFAIALASAVLLQYRLDPRRRGAVGASRHRRPASRCRAATTASVGHSSSVRACAVARLSRRREKSVREYSGVAGRRPADRMGVRSPIRGKRRPRRSDLYLVFSNLRPISGRLAHHRFRHSVRSPILVRRFAVDHSPQRSGPQSGRQGDEASGLKLEDSRVGINAGIAAQRLVFNL